MNDLIQIFPDGEAGARTFLPDYNSLQKSKHRGQSYSDRLRAQEFKRKTVDQIFIKYCLFRYLFLLVNKSNDFYVYLIICENIKYNEFL